MSVHELSKLSRPDFGCLSERKGSSEIFFSPSKKTKKTRKRKTATRNFEQIIYTVDMVCLALPLGSFWECSFNKMHQPELINAEQAIRPLTSAFNHHLKRKFLPAVCCAGS
jgi:hypothetical protein